MSSIKFIRHVINPTITINAHRDVDSHEVHTGYNAIEHAAKFIFSDGNEPEEAITETIITDDTISDIKNPPKKRKKKKK